MHARSSTTRGAIHVVAAGVAVHGEEVIAALRKQNPATYARLVSDLVQFKKLATERAPQKNPGQPRRKPRPLVRTRVARTGRAEPHAREGEPWQRIGKPLSLSTSRR